jgi:hypothetical protein
LSELQAAKRVFEATAKALMLPARTKDWKLDDGSIIRSICPATRSWVAGPLPRYGARPNSGRAGAEQMPGRRAAAEARRVATPRNNRFYRIFEELALLGIRAEPVIYDESFGDEVRGQLLAADALLVWVDPIHQGKTRALLDPLLRDVSTRGPWVSAIPARVGFVRADARGRRYPNFPNWRPDFGILSAKAESLQGSMGQKRV